MAESETILNPSGTDNSDLTIDTKAEGNIAPTDTQEVLKDKSEPWVNGLDPELKEHPSLKNFKSPNDLAKSWVNAQKLIGKDKVALLNEKSTPEEREAFYNKLGRPEKPEGYKFEPLPEPIQNESREKNFAEFAHKQGFTQAQASALRGWWASEMNAEMSQMGEQNENTQKETETELRREWGMAYQAKMVTANKVLSQFSEPTQKKIMGAFGNDPDVIRDLAKMGGKFSEAGMIGKSPDGMMSPEEAQAEIAKLKVNPAYLDGQHPEHKIVVSRMTQLFKMLHPE
jgi:hypothetical protein